MPPKKGRRGGPSWHTQAFSPPNKLACLTGSTRRPPVGSEKTRSNMKPSDDDVGASAGRTEPNGRQIGGAASSPNVGEWREDVCSLSPVSNDDDLIGAVGGEISDDDSSWSGSISRMPEVPGSSLSHVSFGLGNRVWGIHHAPESRDENFSRLFGTHQPRQNSSFRPLLQSGDQHSNLWNRQGPDWLVTSEGSSSPQLLPTPSLEESSLSCSTLPLRSPDANLSNIQPYRLPGFNRLSSDAAFPFHCFVNSSSLPFSSDVTADNMSDTDLENICEGAIGGENVCDNSSYAYDLIQEEGQASLNISDKVTKVDAMKGFDILSGENNHEEYLIENNNECVQLDQTFMSNDMMDKFEGSPKMLKNSQSPNKCEHVKSKDGNCGVVYPSTSNVDRSKTEKYPKNNPHTNPSQALFGGNLVPPFQWASNMFLVDSDAESDSEDSNEISKPNVKLVGNTLLKHEHMHDNVHEVTNQISGNYIMEDDTSLLEASDNFTFFRINGENILKEASANKQLCEKERLWPDIYDNTKESTSGTEEISPHCKNTREKKYEGISISENLPKDELENPLQGHRLPTEENVSCSDIVNLQSSQQFRSNCINNNCMNIETSIESNACQNNGVANDVDINFRESQDSIHAISTEASDSFYDNEMKKKFMSVESISNENGSLNGDHIDVGGSEKFISTPMSSTGCVSASHMQENAPCSSSLPNTLSEGPVNSLRELIRSNMITLPTANISNNTNQSGDELIHNSESTASIQCSVHNVDCGNVLGTENNSDECSSVEDVSDGCDPSTRETSACETENSDSPLQMRLFQNENPNESHEDADDRSLCSEDLYSDVRARLDRIFHPPSSDELDQNIPQDERAMSNVDARELGEMSNFTSNCLLTDLVMDPNTSTLRSDSSQEEWHSNWYFYDHRLIPAGRITERITIESELNGALVSESLPGILSPPSYEEVMNEQTPPQPVSGPVVEEAAAPCEPPPPYSVVPPPYSETDQHISASVANSLADSDSVASDSLSDSVASASDNSMQVDQIQRLLGPRGRHIMSGPIYLPDLEDNSIQNPLLHTTNNSRNPLQGVNVPMDHNNPRQNLQVPSNERLSQDNNSQFPRLFRAGPTTSGQLTTAIFGHGPLLRWSRNSCLDRWGSDVWAF